MRAYLLLVMVAVAGCGNKKDAPASSTPAPESKDTPGAPAAPGAAGQRSSLGKGSSSGEFTPSTRGFKFQNYGDDIPVENLTAAEVQRLFGDKVCGDKQDGACILTPPAERWMVEQNKGMRGGHCEGMATVALLFQLGKLAPADFGGPTAHDLELTDNKKLQHEIAYWFVTQGLEPMYDAGNVKMTPTEVIAKLADAFDTNKESYTLGFYKADGTGGHATTPYAVVDKGNGITWILHYDNNYPGEERHIEIDRNKNTWSYVTASDPSQAAENYDGDATTKTLGVSPTSARIVQQQCPFCGDVDAAGGADDKGAKGARRQVSLEGGADLLITEDDGKRIGHVDGKLVDEIPGANAIQQRATSRRSAHEPTYDLPAGHKLMVTLDGSVLTAKQSNDVTIEGPGYSMGVYDVGLSPGEKDQIEISPSFDHISYATEHDETPEIEITIETSGADYAFDIHAGGESGGQRVDLALDIKTGTLSVEASAKDGTASYEVEIHRVDDHGEQVFEHKGVSSGAKDRLVFHYADWKGNGQPVKADIDHGEDGTIDASEELSDED